MFLLHLLDVYNVTMTCLVVLCNLLYIIVSLLLSGTVLFERHVLYHSLLICAQFNMLCKFNRFIVFTTDL